MHSKTKVEIELLWDRLSVVAMIAMLSWLWLARDRYAHEAWGFAFGLLYVPALVGNLTSMVLLWQPRTSTGRPIRLLRASVIVGVVGWALVVPLTSWTFAPLLTLRPGFDAPRELAVLLAYLGLGEVWFYCVHRILHAHRSLFRLFHAHHHRITDPHVVNASYQHPVEMVVITMGTAWVGPLLIPGHWLTVAGWCALVMILGNYGHCEASTIHEQHHRRARGNYGFLFMDYVLGTLRSH